MKFNLSEMHSNNFTLQLQVEASSSEDCHNLCHSYDGCGWFSYEPIPSVCLLFKDCPTLDKSCEICVSSSALCKAKTSISYNI